MKMLRVAMAGVILLGASAVRLNGGEPRQQPIPPPSGSFPGTGRMPGEEVPASPELAQRQALARNVERQKRLVTDTDKLLALATDLKQEVDKTNRDILSVDVIKKADEIEKLAHSVKERMKN